MAEFVMRSSVIRRTFLLASFIPLIFIADFASTYWTNQRLVRDLGIIHRTDESYQALDRAATSLAAAKEAVKSDAERPDSAKRSAIFENLRHAVDFADQSGGTRPNDRIHQGLAAIREAAERSRSADPKAVPGEVLLASQFALETEEEFRKLQFAFKGEGQAAFDRIYGDRWLPLFVSTILDISFLIVLFLLIVPPLRSLVGSVRNLNLAADRIMGGESTYQAPILSDDELGRITDVFNRVVSALNLKEQEAETRVASELSRLEFIARSAGELAQSIEMEEIFRRIAKAAVPFLGDWCVVDAISPDGALRRAAFEHRDPDQIALMSRLVTEGAKRVEESVMISAVVGSRRAIISPPELPELWDQEWPGKSVVRALGAGSVLSVPIIVRGDVSGVLTVISTREASPYGRKEQLVAEDLARRAGYAIENARLLREAKEAIETRDDFLSIASHELRTPLTPLRMQIQMLGRTLSRAGEVSAERVQAAIATCDRMVSRLSKLVEDLLEVSRINSGRLELQYEEVDFAELIREVHTRFQWDLDRATSKVVLESPPSIPGEFDPGKIEQVFVNLLTNAIKYGDGKPVSVRVSATDSRVRLEVADGGIGIAKADQARIFGRFERARNTMNISGLGLGLFITSQIVDLHGGTIAIDSELGRGSRFTVELPLRRT